MALSLPFLLASHWVFTMSRIIYHDSHSAESDQPRQPDEVDGSHGMAVGEPNIFLLRAAVIEVIITALIAAKASFRAQQSQERSLVYSFLISAAEARERGAQKTLIAGTVAGVTGMVSGGVNVGFTVRASTMLRMNHAQSQNILERGRGIGQFGEATGQVGSAGASYAAAKDDAESARLEALAERRRAYAEQAMGRAQDANEIINAAIAAGDDLRRSEHDTTTQVSSS